MPGEYIASHGVTGEMIVGPKRVLFMDGLDSSTTFAIIKYARRHPQPALHRRHCPAAART